MRGGTIYIYIIQVRCIFVCSTRRSLPHMHDGLYVLFERAYSSFILCIKLVFMKMMLGFITPSSRKDGMTEGNAEAIMKYIQSVLVLPAQKRSLVKAMFSNRDGRRRHGAWRGSPLVFPRCLETCCKPYEVLRGVRVPLTLGMLFLPHPRYSLSAAAGAVVHNQLRAPTDRPRENRLLPAWPGGEGEIEAERVGDEGHAEIVRVTPITRAARGVSFGARWMVHRWSCMRQRSSRWCGWVGVCYPVKGLRAWWVHMRR